MSLKNQIEEAYARIKPYINRTPLEKSTVLSYDFNADVYLKAEHLQKTGSFKFRGALNKILLLSDHERERGIVAASTGNHGLGVAKAAEIAGVKATVYVPEDASSLKLEGIKSHGAAIEFIKGSCLDAELAAKKSAEDVGQVFISPYNDIDVIAGQGTIGLEIFEDLKDVDAIFVSVGGGGLISGIGSYLKDVNPKVDIVGCWPENSAVMKACLAAGKIIDVDEQDTISDATAGGIEDDSITFEICQRVIDNEVIVSEAEIIDAMKLLAVKERYIVEGSAGVALSAYKQIADQYQRKKVVIILCGRNIDIHKIMDFK